MAPLIGILVGGRGLRMGGVAKGRLTLRSGQTLLERLRAECALALPRSPVVLLGEASAYAGSGLPSLADTPPGIGPLGGLRALLAEARERELSHALALACDLPYIEAALLARLAAEQPALHALAPRAGELWHCLSARYAVEALPDLDAALSAREHSLQRLFARLGARAGALPLSAEELAQLRDWDRPEDRDDQEA